MIKTTRYRIRFRLPSLRVVLRVVTFALILSLWFTATRSSLFWNAALAAMWRG